MLCDEMALAKATYDSLNVVHNRLHLTREEVTQFRPREFKHPFVLQKNPLYGKEAHDWFRGWCYETELDKVLPPHEFERLLKTDCALFNCYCHPITTKGVWGYNWITKYLAYIVVVDDIMAVPETGQDPEAALDVLWDQNLIMLWDFPDDPRLLGNFKDFIRMGTTSEQAYEEKMKDVEALLKEARSNPGKGYPRKFNALSKCFLELWVDGVKGSPPNSILLMGHGIQDWMRGTMEEAVTRLNERCSGEVTLQGYIETRRKSGAFFCLLVCREIACGLTTPHEWFYSPSMAHLVMLASDIISWDNDLLSFTKELLVDNDLTGNVLGAISKYKGVNFEEAVDILHDMMNAKLEEIFAAIAELEKNTLPEHMDSCNTYVQVTKDLLIGTHHWCCESARYTELK